MKKPFIAVAVLLSFQLNAQAARSGANFLQEPSGARAAALAEAFTAGTNDAQALHYNPANLTSLERSQAALSYRKGLADDGHGQFLMGIPFAKNSIGVGVRHYQGGSVLWQEGSTSRSVVSQQDFSITGGYAHQFNRVGVGANLKYISSVLIETYRAQSWAVDLGVSAKLGKQVTYGMAIQNLGEKLHYSNSTGEDTLPQNLRLGFQSQLRQGFPSLTLFTDGVYEFNDKNWVPQLGLEGNTGLVVLRAGIQDQPDHSQKFSVGMGLALVQLRIDYSIGLLQEFGPQHRISLAYEFGKIRSPSTRNNPGYTPRPSDTILVPEQ